MKNTKTIAGKCPVCDAFVPLFTVTAEVRGWIRPKVEMSIEADASDYVAHMWTHSTGEPSWA